MTTFCLRMAAAAMLALALAACGAKTQWIRLEDTGGIEQVARAAIERDAELQTRVGGIKSVTPTNRHYSIAGRNPITGSSSGVEGRVFKVTGEREIIYVDIRYSHTNRRWKFDAMGVVEKWSRPPSAPETGQPALAE